MQINLSRHEPTIKEKIAAYFGFAPVAEIAKYKKPRPKFKKEVLTIIETLQKLGFRERGVIKDEFVYILMYEKMDETYYLHLNYLGEYVGIFKMINCQHIKKLCAMLETPNLKVIEARKHLERASEQLAIGIKNLTVIRETDNLQEKYELTDREQTAVAGMNESLSKVRAASVLMRDYENG
jgi:hypothetical protein